jgi:predicted PurR-regulated permease PerM
MNVLRMPAYARYTVILFGLSLLVLTLYMGRNIIVPVYVASLLAWLMVPFSSLLEKRGLSRKLGAVLSIVAVLIFLTLLTWFFVTQIRGVSSTMDQMQERLLLFKEKAFGWAGEKFGLPDSQMDGYTEQAGQSIRGYASRVGSLASSLFIASILLPMSMYFFLSYRHFYHEFLKRLASRNAIPKIEEAIDKEEQVVRRYLLGILAVVFILSVCNITALMIIGVEHALLFGVVAALLNIVPVVGTILGSLIPVAYVLIMKDEMWYPLVVALYFWGIQILESSILTPTIVGKRMGVNPYAILLAIFIGSAVWGPVGMVLFIPLVAQVKVICTIVEPLKPFGFVLSDPEKDSSSFTDTFRGWWQKLQKKE